MCGTGLLVSLVQLSNLLCLPCRHLDGGAPALYVRRKFQLFLHWYSNARGCSKKQSCPCIREREESDIDAFFSLVIRVSGNDFGRNFRRYY
ncbi:hypothetical protein DFH94DRAFT_12433 [Russula ochroleuca]|uniref:Secreted protein n=1 Tax=Russula ochroleuca TaxID=152965 RepID=A0A9P5TDT7_9AGAM|nr:hypothetical protein DFH94DRAFT_12433 [Russula ochroleuca]